jgi:hypothetical protein
MSFFETENLLNANPVKKDLNAEVTTCTINVASDKSLGLKNLLSQ